MSWRSFLFRQWRSHPCFSLWMTSCHPKGKAGWAQPDLRPDGDLTHGAGAVKLGGTRALAWEEPDFSVEADAERHQSPCSDRRPDGRRTKEMKVVSRARARRRRGCPLDQRSRRPRSPSFLEKRSLDRRAASTQKTIGDLEARVDAAGATGRAKVSVRAGE